MKNNENRSLHNAKKRIRMAEIFAVLIPVAFMAVFGTKYVILPMTNTSYAATKSTVTYDEIKSYVVEGDILDRRGNMIMGNATPGSGAFANAPENRSYAYLLGYYTVNSNTENRYGLRGNLYEHSLFTLDENNKGQTVILTTDNALQDYAYTNILAGQEGSVTVIDNSTGEILCLTSQSTIDYDVNDTASFVTNTQYNPGWTVQTWYI